jgi:hypothetical protein
LPVLMEVPPNLNKLLNRTVMPSLGVSTLSLTYHTRYHTRWCGTILVLTSLPGIGAVVGEGSSNTTTPSGSASASASASATTSTGSGVTNYQPSTAASPIANPSNGSGPSRVTSASASAPSESESASASASAASASTSPNAAGRVAAGGLVGIVGLGLGLFL